MHSGTSALGVRKTLLILISIFLLFSCTTENQKTDVTTSKENKKEITYTVWAKQNETINIYWNILNNNIKELSTDNWWKIEYLNCETWRKVTPDTLIAKITPNLWDLQYKNNMVQLNSLNQQLVNQENIKRSTIQNFESQERQINLQKNDLKNKLSTWEKNLSILKDQKWFNSNDIDLKISSLENQLEMLNETKELVERNKKETLSDINKSIENIKWQIYNTSNKALLKLDETFWISEENNNTNNNYEKFLGAKNTKLKNEVENELRKYIWDNKTLEITDSANISSDIKNLSNTLKKAWQVVKDSINSNWSLSQSTIDILYETFIGFSDWLLTYKTNYDKLINAVGTTSLTFDTEIKTIDQNLESLNTSLENLKNNWSQSADLTFDSNINSLENQLSSLTTGEDNLEEQLKTLLETKKSQINWLDMQIINIKDWISKMNIMLSPENIYAETFWTIKQKSVKLNNTVRIWSPICSIVPKNNSLKLELYSPIKLNIWNIFTYLKDWELHWTWTIISESPVKNSLTQNYIYQWEIDFKTLNEWDYLNIKVLNTKEESNDIKNNEIWIPINYVSPKLDWFYVNKLMEWWNIKEIKVEVWNMNNWEIRVVSGLSNGNILQK